MAFAMPGAYDRAITVFSPEGRLFQVEYAFEAVNRGMTIVGIRCSEGIVLAAEEVLESELKDPDFEWKLYQIDEHIGTAIAGLASDARILIDHARIYAQSNRLIYDEPVDVEMVAKRICDIKQAYTQYAGVRPFGVSLIVGGIDKTGPRLFMTNPGGVYHSYKAVAVGRGQEVAGSVLLKEYREDTTLDEAISLALKCLIKSAEASGEEARFRVAVIPVETKKFRSLSREEVEKCVEDLRRAS